MINFYTYMHVWNCILIARYSKDQTCSISSLASSLLWLKSLLFKSLEINANPDVKNYKLFRTWWIVRSCWRVYWAWVYWIWRVLSTRVWNSIWSVLSTRVWKVIPTLWIFISSAANKTLEANKYSCNWICLRKWNDVFLLKTNLKRKFSTQVHVCKLFFFFRNLERLH